MNVVVVDQDSLYRARLKRRLEKIPGIAVIGEASESAEAAAMIVNRKPDIVILDAELNSGNGIEVLCHVKDLLLRPTVIMLSNHPSQEVRSTCATAGANFVFDKALEAREVVNTVRLLCVTDQEQDPAGSNTSLPD